MTARLLACGVLVMLFSSTAASARGYSWSSCGDFAAAQSAEKPKDKPLCIYYYNREDLGQPKDKDADKTMSLELNPAYQNLPRIHMVGPSRDPAFASLVKRLGCSAYPMVVLGDCRGHILGVTPASGAVVEPGHVNETDARAPADQVATAQAVVKWEKSVDDQLNSLDDKLKNHQYAAVATLLAKIEAQDRKFTNQLAAVVPWQPADQQDPWFYKKEVGDARDKLKEAIKKEIAADTELLAAGKRQQVRHSLDNMLFFKDDPELAKQIADLKKSYDGDPKAGGTTTPAPAPVSASSAAPAGASPVAAP